MNSAAGASPAPHAAGRRPVPHAIPLCAIALVGLFAYSNALGGPFVFDDARHIRDNPVIRDLSNYLARWDGYRAMPNRWVAYLTFAVNYRLGGLAVAGYHVFNVAVHLTCAAALYALVVLSFRTPRLSASRLAPASRWLALAAALLFVAHPLQTQAVTYVVQRIASLATLLYLASVTLYAAARVRGEARAASRGATAACWAGALACALAAMKTKEIAFTLPFAIAIWDLSFFPPGRGRWRRLTPFLATAAVIPLTLVDLRGHAGAVLAEAGARTRLEHATLSRLDYLRTEIPVVASYLRLLVFPAGQSLDHDPPVFRTFLAPPVLGALALLVALAAAATAAYALTSPRAGRRAVDPAARLAGFGVAWFFLGLAVESSVIPIPDLMYEHRVYLPSIGFFVAVVSGAALAVAHPGRRGLARVAGVLVAAAVLVLAVATQRRNEVWATDVALWADAASKAPGKARPFYNLGCALATAGRLEEAGLSLRRALRLDPGAPLAHAQLGSVLVATGRLLEAEPELREAVQLDPRLAEPTFNLATVLWQTGRGAEARVWFARFLELAPATFVEARRIAAERVRG